MARRYDIATNPTPEALFEAGSAGFQIWCTPDDHPRLGGCPFGCRRICETLLVRCLGYVGLGGETITYLCLETNAYDLRLPDERQPKIQNRPDDVSWAEQKIRWLFKQAGVPCPPILVVKE